MSADSGYFDNQSYEVMIPTAWIPLLDTDDFNGGMQVIVFAENSC